MTPRVPPGTPGFPDGRGPTPQPVGVWAWLRLLWKIAREWRKERKRKKAAEAMIKKALREKEERGRGEEGGYIFVGPSGKDFADAVRKFAERKARR